MLDLGVIQLTYGAAGSWALFVVVVVALIKAWPALTKLRLESDASLRKDLLDEVRSLRKDVSDCRAECSKNEAVLEERLRAKDEKLRGLQTQFLTLQIVLARNGQAMQLGSHDPAIAAMVEKLLPAIYGTDEHIAALIREGTPDHNPGESE